MTEPQLTRLTSKNLLYLIRTVPGSELFKHVYVQNAEGKEFDAMNDGDLSCALLVSGVLVLVALIDHPHSTVQTTIAKMKEAGWVLTDKPRPGDVVHWPAGGDGHEHIGFVAEDGKFVSNSSVERKPVIHDAGLADGRQPDAYYTHPQLQK